MYLASFVVPNLERLHFQKGHSVLRCTLRFYFTLILQSNMGTLEAHSGVGVYLASFVVPNLERSALSEGTFRSEMYSSILFYTDFTV